MHVYCSTGEYPEDSTLPKPTGLCSLIETRIPRRIWEPWIDAAQYVINSDLVYRPDRFRRWSHRIATHILKNHPFDPNSILVTFGTPMSCHLAGLRIKRHRAVFGRPTPWIAHFSDPWADNPLSKLGRHGTRAALKMEREVIESADRIVFTCEEALDWVMQKYSQDLKRKARVLPHCFDATLPVTARMAQQTRITLRHLGDFYDNRTPEPLLKILSAFANKYADALRNVTVEFIGSTPAAVLRKCPSLSDLPQGLIRFRSTVSYREAMDLMIRADGLLVVDAPFQKSPFLPSKLIDYIGVDRPILGLTPLAGASSRVIQSVGGWVADSSQPEQAIERFRDFLSYLKDSPSSQGWIPAAVRERYSPDTVAQRFESIIGELAPCAAS